MTLDGSGSSDPEGHTITYAWTQVDGAGQPDHPDGDALERHRPEADVHRAGHADRYHAAVPPRGHRPVRRGERPGVRADQRGSNLRPIANAGPDQTPGRGKVVTLDGSGSSDPEGTAITYQWVQTDVSGSPIIPGDPLAVSLSSSTVQKPTFTAPVPAVFPKDLFFRLFVTDTTGLLSDPDTVVIHLVESNAPTANAGAAQTNKATNSTVTLTGAASTDPDCDP